MAIQDGYTVIARKWRPKSFADIVGQTHVCITLKHALEEGRVAHAYLFTGPRGVGKTTTARVLAKALNCEQGPTVEPCGVCQACVGISQGSFMDVLEIDGASNRGIDEVRELRESVRFAPAVGRYKVVVIDEVHMLTQPAFNALLKTLEEPPSHVVFILATTDPGQILPTIVSRCQRFDFHMVSHSLIVERLRTIADKEGFAVQDTVLFGIASLAEGSLRDAEGLLDQLASYVGDSEATLEDIRSITRGVSRENLASLMVSIAEETPQDLLCRLDEMIRSGSDPVFLLGSLLKHIREILLVKLGQKTSQMVPSDEQGILDLEKEARLFSMADIMTLMAILSDTESRMRWSGVPRVLLEISLLKACQWIPSLTVNELLREVKQWNPSSSSIQETPTCRKCSDARDDAKESSLVSQSKVPVQESRSAESFVFEQFVDRVKSQKPMLAVSLMAARCQWVQDRSLLLLEAPSVLIKEQLQAKESMDLLEGVLHDMIGPETRIGISMSMGATECMNPGKSDEKEGASCLQEEASDMILGDKEDKKSLDNEASDLAKNPFVKQTMETFKAKLIKVDKPQPFDIND